MTRLPPASGMGRAAVTMINPSERSVESGVGTL
jgi:hypothetical protein